ncbi:MAG: hypothetical protein U0231_12500 [Nitrospiraceae bacterium]
MSSPISKSDRRSLRLLKAWKSWAMTRIVKVSVRADRVQVHAV